MTETELRMVLLWERGNDTKDIGKAMCMPEHHIYNALPRLLNLRRQGRITSTLEP